MKKWKIKKINKKTWALIILVAILLIFPTNITLAADPAVSWPVRLLGSLVNALVSFLGQILIWVIGLLVEIASYSTFINSPAVNHGWSVVRDLANMFFIIVLLVIAFATILGIENYNYKKWLPKLILMAILINFSKTICGLLIDVSQVIMLTFVNAFSAVSSGNLIDMLGIAHWRNLQAKEVSDAGVVDWQVAAAFLLALFYVLISLVTVVAMLAMLVMRIIMIWIYVVLSPLAYLLAAFPGGAKYASRWWSEFVRNLIIGPVLAFFIWLSFAALGVPSDPVAGDAVASFSSTDLMMKFMIAIAMLIGGMKIAQEIGGESGNVAGKTFSKVKGMGIAAGGFALAKAKWAGKEGGKRVAAVAGTAGGYADRLAGNLIDRGRGTQRFGDRGVIGTAAGFVSTTVGKTRAKMRSSLKGSPYKQEMDEQRRTYYEDFKKDKNAVMKFGDKKYQIAREGVHKGNFVELDKNNKQTGKALLDEDGKAVSSMSASAAAWHDSKRNSFRQISSDKDKRQTEKVEEAKKNLLAMNLSSGEVDRKLNSSATSAIDKMALSMIKAEKGSFKTPEQVKNSKQYLQGNKVLISKFDDALDAKRPDLNYDFDSDADISRLKDRLRKNKLDPSKLAASAYANPKALKAIKEFSGDKFNKIIETVADNNDAEFSEMASQGLLAMRDNQYDSGDTIEAVKTSKIHADVKGQWDISFKKSDDSLNTQALGQYIATANAKKLNNMDAKDYSSMSDEAKNAVRDNITAKQLKTMAFLDTNRELVQAIRDDIIKNGKPSAVINPKTGQASKGSKVYDDIINDADILSV